MAKVSVLLNFSFNWYPKEIFPEAWTPSSSSLWVAVAVFISLSYCLLVSENLKFDLKFKLLDRDFP